MLPVTAWVPTAAGSRSTSTPHQFGTGHDPDPVARTERASFLDEHADPSGGHFFRSRVYRESVNQGGTDPAGYTIRPAERADLLAVVRIERASFPQPWPYDAFLGFLGEPGFLVAVDDEGAIVGYIVADVAATHGDDVGHVKDVAVHPDHRGEGLGSTLLTRALATLASTGVDSVTLEVRASNEEARRLYRRFGFTPLRRVEDYYADDEDALVLLREFGRR